MGSAVIRQRGFVAVTRRETAHRNGRSHLSSQLFMSYRKLKSRDFIREMFKPNSMHTQHIEMSLEKPLSRKEIEELDQLLNSKEKFEKRSRGATDLTPQRE